MPAKGKEREEKRGSEGKKTGNRVGVEPLDSPDFSGPIPIPPETETKGDQGLIEVQPSRVDIFPSPESSTRADHGSPEKPDFLQASSVSHEGSPPANPNNPPAQISEEVLEQPIQLVEENRTQAVSHDSTAAITEVAVKSSCCSSICRPFSLSGVRGFFAGLLGQGDNHNDSDRNSNSGGRD